MQCKPNYPRLRLVIHNIATQCPSIRGMLTCNSPKAQSLILLRLALPALFLSWMFPKVHRKTVIEFPASILPFSPDSSTHQAGAAGFEVSNGWWDEPLCESVIAQIHKVAFSHCKSPLPIFWPSSEGVWVCKLSGCSPAEKVHFDTYPRYRY